MKTKLILILILTILLNVLVTLSPVQAQSTPWVKILNYQENLILSQDVNCYWPEQAIGLQSFTTLNMAGRCGRSAATKNVYMVYGHNLSCDHGVANPMCHYSRAAVDISVLGALVIGDKVQLFDGKRLLNGTVFEIIRNAGPIDGNTEYTCPGKFCGTFTTCVDVQPAHIVVRVVYQ